jgi:hypothetical protein
VKTYADKLLLLLEDNPKPVAEGGDTPAQLAAKAALRARFTDYDLPADFVEDLRHDRDAMDEADEGKNTGGEDSVKATTLISTLLDQIDDEIIQIDATLRNRYSRKPELLAAWHSASHLERAPQRRKKEGSSDPGSTGSGTSTPAK